MWRDLSIASCKSIATALYYNINIQPEGFVETRKEKAKQLNRFPSSLRGYHKCIAFHTASGLRIILYLSDKIITKRFQS